MISGIFHKGSGVGNQLHRYVATRVLALDKGYEWRMAAPELCKVDFMNLDMGQSKFNEKYYTVDEKSGEVNPILPEYDFRIKNKWKENTNYYNPEFNFIEDNTIIDGEFQDERYFGHRLKEINEWLNVEPIDIPDNVCVIGFRGGEFYTVPELGLPPEYYAKAMEEMLNINYDMRFEVHTDDVALADKFFGGPSSPIKIIHDVGVNWRSMRYAKYAIIANSSFYILPRWLNGGVTIAPRYWDRHNIKVWERPYNYYKSFQYI